MKRMTNDAQQNVEDHDCEHKLGMCNITSVIAQLAIVQSSGIYVDIELLGCGITKFKNRTQQNRCNQEAEEKIHERLIVIVECGIYELAVSFITIISFYYWFEQCFDNFDINKNYVKKFNKTSIIVNFCLVNNVLSQFNKHKKK